MGTVFCLSCQWGQCFTHHRYCIKLRIHGTSSSVLQNRLLLIHMLEYVEQHPTLYIFRKQHFGMMNVQCIYDALSRWNVGEGHIRHTRSHHSPAKLM